MTEIIYTGRCKLKNKKTGMLFITVEKLRELEENHLRAGDTIDQWSSPFESSTSFSPRVIGGIFKTTHNLNINDEGQIRSMHYGALTFVSMSESEALANWRIRDAAIDEEKRIASHTKRAEESTDLSRAVETLKRHYVRVSPGYRRSFQMWLLNELEKR